jgi:ABC-2 type transport system permease protein
MSHNSSYNLTWVPFFSLFYREIRRFFKVFFQTLATPLISTLLYLLIFGLSIGKEIKLIQNHSYLEFLIPGLVMMATLRNAFDNSSGSIITSKFCGELEDLRISPLSPLQIAWANGLGSLTRGLIVGGMTLVLGILFTWISNDTLISIEHPFLLLLFLLTGGMAFANLGLSVSMRAETFEQVSAVSTFILLPLIYLGGVFFSLDHLHPIWQTLSKFNPLLYLVNGVRYSILGFSDVDINISIVVSLVTLAVFHLFAIWSLKKGSYHRW